MGQTPIIEESYDDTSITTKKRLGRSSSSRDQPVLEMTFFGLMMRNRVPAADQRSCNACWAVATIQAMSDRLRYMEVIPTNDQLNYYVFHDRIVYETGDNDCVSGALLETGMNMSISEGAPLMSQTKDRGFNDTIDPYDLRIPTYKAKRWIQIHGIDNIKRELDTRGTVIAVINLYDSFVNHIGAEPYQPYHNEYEDEDMAHMICIVGYDDRDNTWILRNSYGSKSGVNGYIKVYQGDPSMDTEHYVYAPIF